MVAQASRLCSRRLKARGCPHSTFNATLHKNLDFIFQINYTPPPYAQISKAWRMSAAISNRCGQACSAWA
jgi:hypothetical protein